MYRVEKVLNHNALIGIPENTTQEYLIMGKGIGFGKHVSETIEITDEYKIIHSKSQQTEEIKKN